MLHLLITGAQRYMILLLLMFLMSCKEDMTPPSKEEIVGVYMKHYFGGIETFILNQDGTFSQEFKKSGTLVYKSKGKWEIDNEMLIRLSPCMYPAGAWTSNAEGPPQTTETSTGEWHRGPIRIMFFEKLGYWVVKVEGLGATEDRKIIERAYD